VHGIAEGEGAVGNIFSIGLLILVVVFVLGGHNDVALGISLARIVTDLFVRVLGTDVDEESAQTGTEDTGLGQTGGWLGCEPKKKNAEGDVDTTATNTTSRGDTGRQEPNESTDNVIPQIVIVLVAARSKECAAEANVVVSVCIRVKEAGH